MAWKKLRTAQKGSLSWRNAKRKEVLAVFRDFSDNWMVTLNHRKLAHYSVRSPAIADARRYMRNFK